MGIKAIGETEELYEGLNMLSIAGTPTLQLQTVRSNEQFCKQYSKDSCNRCKGFRGNKEFV